MSGKVALVTGGSRGIGRAIVESLAKSGCNVVVNFVKNESAALETCDHVTSNYQGVRLVPFKADCSNPDEVQNMFKFIKTEVICEICKTLCSFSSNCDIVIFSLVKLIFW